MNTMSVGENIFLGRFKEMKGMRGTHAKARELLDSIGCKVSTTKLVSELSVSTKQMVEISKALSFQSKLIIMDEPAPASPVKKWPCWSRLSTSSRPGNLDHLYQPQARGDL